MNILDKTVAYFSPLAAAKRAQARSVIAYYEAAEPSRLRNYRRNAAHPNNNVQRSAYDLMLLARQATDNHDIARGILKTITANVIGKGVGVEPQPRNRDGSINEELASNMRELYRDWCKRPEVTHRHNWGQTQRLALSAQLRDGDSFAQMISGEMPTLNHGTRVPFSIELIGAESVPLMLNNADRRIIQGIQINTWGKPVALHVLKTQPWLTNLATLADTKTIPWDRVLHLCNTDYIGQLRGVSVFASVLNRLEDIKDYEESERVAAKIAAMLSAYVKKGQPDDYTVTAEPREISLSPGMIIDDLAPGEEIGMIDSKRPNPNLITFRAGQLKAVAAGVSAGYSSIAKSYDGTFSAQRQELVEQWVNYSIMTDEFVCNFVQPCWEQFVRMAILSGQLKVPAGIVEESIDDALFIGQSMPWIDPLKEALGFTALIDAGLASEVEIIRKRGQNPYDVIEQSATFRQKMQDKGLAKVDGKVNLLDLIAVE